jgi:hypothetical protein
VKIKYLANVANVAIMPIIPLACRIAPTLPAGSVGVFLRRSSSTPIEPVWQQWLALIWRRNQSYEGCSKPPVAFLAL